VAWMMPSASSPSRSLPEVRFLRFLVSLGVWSLIHSHRVEVFEAEIPMPPGTTARYDRGRMSPVVPCRVRSVWPQLDCRTCPVCLDLRLEGFYGVRMTYLLPNMVSPIDCWLSPSVLGFCRNKHRRCAVAR
jgi:hypothetical protein